MSVFHFLSIRYLLAKICLGCMCISTVATGQVINEDPDGLLFADVLDEWDAFGASVAIDDETDYTGSSLATTSGVKINQGIYVVGAPSNWHNSTSPGAVYIFDIETKELLKKIIAPISASGDHFGNKLALDDGILAVQSWEGGGNSSIHVYNILNNTFITKLTATPNPDGSNNPIAYGKSFALDEDTLVVGVPEDNSQWDFGADHGSVYVYTASTGAFRHIIYPSESQLTDEEIFRDPSFGISVAVFENTIAVAKATNATISGPVIPSGNINLYNASSGSLVNTITPPSSGTSSFTGMQGLELSGDVIAISCNDIGSNLPNGNTHSVRVFNTTSNTMIAQIYGDQTPSALRFAEIDFDLHNNVLAIADHFDPNADGTFGAVYLYEADTGNRIVKIENSEPFDIPLFGDSVATRNGQVLVGQRVGPSEDLLQNRGRALICSDIDGDGLLNTWELKGIPYKTASGTYEHYLLEDADVLHKDIYVEIDSMIGHSFNLTAQNNVVAAFAGASNDLVDNPDDFDGITLHLDIDEKTLPVVDFPNSFSDFDDVKEDHFGTTVERLDPAILDAKAKAYRYCIFGRSYGGSDSSGLAETPGNDFMVTLGLWPGGGTVDQQAGTFMHELGHTLGLGHGGISDDGVPDHINRKPNYYSVMNYNWQMPNDDYSKDWTLGYSIFKLDTLDESALIEADGIDGSDSRFVAAKTTPHGYNGQMPDVKLAKTNGTAVDWNGNGVTDTNPVAVDISQVSEDPSPGQSLHGSIDWPNLRYRLGGHINFDDGQQRTTAPEEELSYTMYLAQTVTQCSSADFDYNGVLDFFDISIFLDAFAAADPLADLDGNGIFDFFDTSIFLDKFAEGCP